MGTSLVPIDRASAVSATSPEPAAAVAPEAEPAKREKREKPLRRIVLCADDYGLAPGVDAAIRDLIERGRLNATSVMVLPPTFSREEADRLAALNVPEKRVQIGLHVTLTGLFVPLTESFAPLAPGGTFLPIGPMLLRAYLRPFDRDVVRREVEAQMKAFIAAFGRPPDFVDGHQHVHLLPRVRDAVLTVTRDFAPDAWLRQCGRPLWRLAGDPKGVLIALLSRTLRRRARKLGLATNPTFSGTYTFGEEAPPYATLFPKFLDGIRDGGVIMCHPGTVDIELMRQDPMTLLREAEYAFLGGDAFPAVLAGRRVTLALD